MDTGRHLLQVPEEMDRRMDKYTASIELSNACRQFYKSRVEAAHYFKTRWERQTNSTCCNSSGANDKDRPASGDSNSNVSRAQKPRNSIEKAMNKLRTEITSLMDQDLSLMKQLLTLNETIEELKSQRQYYYSCRSLPGSSADLHHSDCSVSDTEMYDSASEDDCLSPMSTTVCSLSMTTPSSSCKTPIMLQKPQSTACSPHRKLGLTCLSAHTKTTHALCSGEKRSVDSETVVVESSPVKAFHTEQNSFDSGIHEPGSEEETEI